MNTRYRAVIGVVMAAVAGVTMAADNAATAPTGRKAPPAEMKLTVQGRPEHPTVYVSRADVERARRNREKYAWGKAAAARVLKDAEAWMARSDAEVLKLIPSPGACFAYGFSGCPVCGGTFASWWGEGGVATLDDPGHVKCVNGHRLPDAEHPDAGDGWTDKTGKKFYFVGAYNSFMVQRVSDGAESLATAYAVTGDEKYAERAALILDHLARVYPSCDKGSWDYPSTPPSGRFNRPWYQVARMLVHYAHVYDLLLMGKVLDGPSSVPGMTRRQNVEQNLLLNGAKYCYERSLEHPALHNGQCDYLRGCMVVGVAMGIPEYVAWGVDGPYGIRNMIENNIDRDGQYYETSSGYSHHSRYLYVNTAEILKNYSDAAHPKGIRLTDMPKFRAFSMMPRARLDAAGMLVTLGDDAPKTKRVQEKSTNADDLMDLEHLYALDGGADVARLRVSLAGGKLDAVREDLVGVRANNSGATTGFGTWLLFNGDEPKVEEGTAAGVRAGDSIHPLTGVAISAGDLVGQRGLAILRSGSGDGRRAVTLRSGPTLNHGNFDEMNLNVYARGFEMTYDLGYSLGSSHVYNGWSKQTASHNTVLVDETSQLKDGRAGGSVLQFAVLPGVQMIRADDPSCYSGQKLERYERTLLMVDAPAGGADVSYILDVFRVAGGTKHDYMFHGMGTDVTTEAVDFGPAGKGSVAGDDVAWGDMIGPDGDVQGVANKPYWVVPPGNGFGFLMRPRTAEPTGPWSAEWKVADDARLRLTMLPSAGAQVVTADAPGIYPTFPRATYVMARRKGENLRSTFAGIVEPYGNARAIRSIESLANAGEGGDSAGVAAKVTLQDGATDYVMQAGTMERRTFQDGGREVSIDGGTAVVRVGEGGPTRITLLGGKRVALENVTVEVSQAEVGGSIDAVDIEKAVLYTRTPLPEGDVLAGQFVHVGSPAYAQQSPYRIQSVGRESDGRFAVQLAPTSLVLGRGHLDVTPSAKDVLANVVPLEYGKSLGRKPSGFFNGKYVTTADGRTATTIRQVAADAMGMRVEDSAGFRAGDDLVVHDVRPGDTFRIPSFVQVQRGADGAWTVHANVAGTVEIAGKRHAIAPSRKAVALESQ